MNIKLLNKLQYLLLSLIYVEICTVS